MIRKRLQSALHRNRVLSDMLVQHVSLCRYLKLKKPILQAHELKDILQEEFTCSEDDDTCMKANAFGIVLQNTQVYIPCSNSPHSPKNRDFDTWIINECRR